LYIPDISEKLIVSLSYKFLFIDKDSTGDYLARPKIQVRAIIKNPDILKDFNVVNDSAISYILWKKIQNTIFDKIRPELLFDDEKIVCVIEDNTIIGVDVLIRMMDIGQEFEEFRKNFKKSAVFVEME
jgi:hypothetical protein